MLSISTAYIAVYDTLADWEIGHLLAELRTGRLTGVPFEILTVAERAEPITTMGGVRIVPDRGLAEIAVTSADVLVLPGSAHWDAGGALYVEERAVLDGDLITAGPQSPDQFAAAVLERLGLASRAKLDAYEAVFHRGNGSAYPALMAA
jgi:hypothetical protein